MKPSDLDRWLKSAEVPQREAAYWDQFAASVRRRIATEPPPLARRRASRAPALWALGAAAAGLVLGFLLWHRSPAPPGSLAVLLQIDDGSHHRDLVTFSGQSLRVGSEQVEVLANPEGQVMLVGEKLLWTNRDEAELAGGVRVRAKLLPQKF